MSLIDKSKVVKLLNERANTSRIYKKKFDEAESLHQVYACAEEALRRVAKDIVLMPTENPSDILDKRCGNCMNYEPFNPKSTNVYTCKLGWANTCDGVNNKQEVYRPKAETDGANCPDRKEKAETTVFHKGDPVLVRHPDSETGWVEGVIFDDEYAPIYKVRFVIPHRAINNPDVILWSSLYGVKDGDIKLNPDWEEKPKENIPQCQACADWQNKIHHKSDEGVPFYECKGGHVVRPTDRLTRFLNCWEKPKEKR